MAVAFFFVLGGFSMTLGYSEKLKLPNWNYNSYLAKRAIKLYPLHWICLVAALPTFLLHPLDFRTTVGLISINAALLQSWVPISKVYYSLNSVSWYLSDTMFFAIVFPSLCRLIMGSNKKQKFTIATILAIIYVIVAIYIPKDKYSAVLYICPLIRLMDFVFGIYLAITYKVLKNKFESKHFCSEIVWQFISLILIVLLVVESCLLGDHTRCLSPLFWPLIGALLLTASLSSDCAQGGGNWLENKYLLRLGNLSFIIYMVHQLILRYVDNIFRLFHLDNVFVLILTVALLTIVVSIIADKYILKPFTQWLTKKLT